jgi:uncharacterized protein
MTKTLTKAAIPFAVKALDEEARTFRGLASTWDLDLGDDVIHEGAFQRTLRDWRKTGRVVPLIDQHNYGSVRAVVGKMTEAEETKDGLDTTWQVIDGPDGDEILRRLRGGYVDGLSIGYRPTKTDFEDSDDARSGQIRNIREAELGEVSVVIFPMNESARVDLASVKSLPRETLTVIRDACVEALAEGQDGEQDPPERADSKGDDDMEPDFTRYYQLQARRLGIHARPGA